MRTPKILISDLHSGTCMTQAATLQKAGADCKWVHINPNARSCDKLDDDEKKVVSLIRKLFSKGSLEEKRRRALYIATAMIKKICGLHSAKTVGQWLGCSWTPQKNRLLSKILDEETLRRIYSGYDIYWASFPPSIAHLYLYLAEKFDKQVVLNLGHRFNIGIKTRKENKALISVLKYLHDHPRHVLAAGSEYECKYVEYYTGFRPKKLPFVCHHLELKIPSPSVETILIGPANIVDKSIENTLNATAQQWCKKNKHEKTMQFSLIRSQYKYFEYEDLPRHPAVVIFPYSAYSINMIELYELNIPFFVPSPDMLLKYGTMRDRALHPIYCDEQQCEKLSVPGKSDMPYSPNSYDEDAQRYWFQFCFFYQVKNAIIWNSEEDLFEKLLATDLEQVRRDMYEENKVKREAVLQECKAIIGAN